MAYDYLEQNGGPAPGPDGCTYADFSNSEKWQFCRDTRDEIRNGTYEPGPERIRLIPKGPGRGKRCLILQSIFDRVVQRAVVEIVQPLVDPQFDAASFGFRPKRSTLHALAAANRLFDKERRSVWVTADIADAFQRVPINRLLDVARKYLFADDLVHFIGTVLSNSKIPGLRQGGPLSPLLLNLFLDHHLDRKWRAKHPDVPLIRYADDILLLCKSVEQAKKAHRALSKLLLPTGMLLKSTVSNGVRTLTPKSPAIWMGFAIQKLAGKLRFGFTDDAYYDLSRALAEMHERSNSPVRAYQSILGWISQIGPCYLNVNRRGLYGQIRETAGQLAFDEIPSFEEVERLSQRAYARWRKLRQSTLSPKLID
jgi:RNA-directed DNA polymerase